MSNIELERRAVLSSEQRHAVLNRMRTLGDIIESRRVIVDFSGENRERTVALQIDDGQQVLVAKTGKLTDTARIEAKVETAADTPLVQTLSYLAILGYQEGMLSVRHKFDVQTPDLKYSVRDVLAQDTMERTYTLFEIEARNVTSENAGAAEQKVLDAFAIQSITPMENAEWSQWVRDVHERVDRPFHYSPENAQALLESLEKFTRRA
jgi:hypothetical protein